jgi:hypothetical protein
MSRPYTRKPSRRRRRPGTGGRLGAFVESGGLQHEAEGSGIEAPRSALSRWPLAELDQGEEPQPSCDEQDQGFLLTRSYPGQRLRAAAVI